MKGGDDIAEKWVFQHAEQWQCTAMYPS